jgi:hypothetical protein
MWGMLETPSVTEGDTSLREGVRCDQQPGGSATPTPSPISSLEAFRFFSRYDRPCRPPQPLPHLELRFFRANRCVGWSLRLCPS